MGAVFNSAGREWRNKPCSLQEAPCARLCKVGKGAGLRKLEFQSAGTAWRLRYASSSPSLGEALWSGLEWGHAAQPLTIQAGLFGLSALRSGAVPPLNHWAGPQSN